MLSKLSEQVSECIGHAEDCARKAAAHPDGSPLRKDFLDMEQRWRSLARSIALTERLTGFLGKASSESVPPKTGFLVDPPSEKHSISCPRCQSPMTWFAAKLANDGSMQNSYQCDGCGFIDQINDKPPQMPTSHLGQ